MSLMPQDRSPTTPPHIVKNHSFSFNNRERTTTPIQFLVTMKKKHFSTRMSSMPHPSPAIPTPLVMDHRFSFDIGQSSLCSYIATSNQGIAPIILERASSIILTETQPSARYLEIEAERIGYQKISRSL